MWDATDFTENRDRLLPGQIATAFFMQVLAQANSERLLSGGQITVEGTLIEAWEDQKSFNPKAGIMQVSTAE